VNGLVEFLRARLDEDEAVARAASQGPANWHTGLGNDDWTRDRMLFDRDGNPMWDNEGSQGLSMPEGVAPHVARHDPARVLADVAAKRAIVDEHALLDPPPEPDDDWPLVCRRCEDRRRHDAMRWPCPTLRRLAAVYADHPDYDQGWAP
jgi:hypothetical protein